MAEFQDYYGTPIAYNPATEELVSDAQFTVHATDDIALATPLRLFDPTSGVEISTLEASNIGVLPDFRVEGDPTQVIIKSGSFTTKLTSVFGAVVQAGLDSATVQAAIAAGQTAATASAAASAARDTAVTASASATVAAERAEAVPATNDGIMTSVAADENSAFANQLSTTIGEESALVATPLVGDAADEDSGDFRVRPNTLSLAPTLSGPGGGNSPGWLSRDRTTLFSVSGARFVRWSTNSGDTWIGHTFEFDAGVTAVRDLLDGEILVFTGRSPGLVGGIWRSTGWAANKTTATFAKVHTASAPDVYFHHGWSISIHENIVLAAEYGTKVAGANARYVYMSLDYGRTWKIIYTLSGAAEHHMHGVAYDKWWKRIWISFGDVTAGVLYSDDMGETWQTAGNLTGAGSLKCTTIVPMRKCVLFLSDTNPNGVWRAPRTSRRSQPVLELAYRLNTATHITHIGATAYRAQLPNAPYLLTFTLDSGGTGVQSPGIVLATVDGYAFHEIWRDADTFAAGGIAAMVGPTVQGQYVGYSADSRNEPGYTMVRMAAPSWSVRDVREKDWYRLGDETMPRLIATGEPQAVTGRLMLTYLTATENVPVSQVVAYTGSVGAGATPTLCRWGVYEVQSNGDLRLMASTPNVPGRFASAYSSVGGAFSAPFDKVAGRRYAIGALCLTTGTAPTIAGVTAASSVKLPSGAFFSEPRIAGRVDGLTDLPTSIASADVLSFGGAMWASLA